MDEPEDLFSRISRNVEANLENFQQHSAWEPELSGIVDPKSSTHLIGDRQSTLESTGDRSSMDLKPSAMSSINIQHWPSPVNGGSSDNFHSVKDTPGIRLESRSQPKPSETTRRVGINLATNNNYVEESTFIRSDSLKSNSMLRLADILSQHILLHPFVALKRTCQVNRKCSPFICIQPFSLIPFMFHQQRKQGIAALYKGLSSELLVKGITLGTETALANYTEWPREVSKKRYLEDSCKILALRGLSVALTTPFLCTSVIETVQSVIVMKDRPSFVDCLRDGFLRLLHLKSTPSNRMLPIWLLVLPTVFYYMTHSAVWHASKSCVEFFRQNILSRCSRKSDTRMTARMLSRRQITDSTMNNSTWQHDSSTYDPPENSIEVDNFEVDSSQISTSIIASLIADVALLPIETVLNCLYIQGTRTIIDNCDETTVVLPVLTNYDGFADCYQSIIKFEGNLGLYKGLGAVILQYSVHFLIFRSLYYLLREFQSNTCDRNAHSKSLSAKDQRPTKQAKGTNADYLRQIENNRHSTPNYYTANFDRTDRYKIDETPKRINRI